MVEVWKDVGDYEGVYQISNLGRIKSLNRIVDWNGTKKHIKEKIRVVCLDGLGYYRTCLNKNGKSKTIKVHRLVAQAFIPNPDNKEEVNHINGIKTDNRVENLEWCTRSENNQHAYKTGLHKPIIHTEEAKNKISIKNRGERNSQSKFKNSDILAIRELRKEGLKHKEIAKRLNISMGVINSVICGISWKHV